MKTYIDEAGIFTDPQYSKAHKVSVVGALVIPDYSYIDVCDLLIRLKKEWGVTGEIKGNQLTEGQVRLLVESLGNHNVLFDAVIVDSKFVTPSTIANHKTLFASAMRANISSFHHPNVKKKITELSNTISELSDQLYVQCLAMTSLIHGSHELSTLFYAQRIPNELAKFEWILDAKQKTKTKSEAWWQDILKPCLQEMSLISPMAMLKEADYSYYQPFNANGRPEGNISEIVKDLSFCDSAFEEGLQLADILTTSLRKALNKKFKIEGWKGIARLMIRKRGQNVLSIVLSDETSEYQNVPYFNVIDILNREARSMII